MTTPPSEPDPYAGTGGSDQDVRGWAVRPAVPGWTAGQQLYTGPAFDDTGWHIDLSGVDWGQEPEADDESEPVRPHERQGRRRTTLRFRNPGRPAGNGHAAPGPADSAARYPSPAPPADAEPGYADYDHRTDAPPARRGRSSGRHARPPQPDGQAPAGAGTGLGRAAPLPGASGPRPVAPPTPSGLPPASARPGRRRLDRTSGPSQVLPGSGRLGPGRPAPARYAPPSTGAPQPGMAVPVPVLPGARPDAQGASIARSSGVMAVGTLGSRLTGFLRTIAQSYALGAAGIAAAYNLSNTLPNVVYSLALGGILTSVIVPLIVNAAKRDGGRSDGYDQRMFTLITLALAGVTIVATAAAVPIVHLYAGSKVLHAPATLHLSVIFALFFIPQIFFYGVCSLIGAILNSRGSFAAPMWTPIVNNFVVIGVLGLYVAMAGLHRTPATMSGSEVGLLGLGTTLGIVAQTVALVPALRRVGFRWHPRTDFRRAEVAEIGRMAGWMFGYIATTQVAFLVTIKVAGDANTAGITDYNYAWLLFQLPYAVVGISVITALLPRMSAHAAERRYRLVRQDFSAGIRLAATIVVPCSLVLAVLGPDLAVLFLGHGATHPAQARYMGVVFSVFCLGLLPYMVFQLQLRVFYALHDSRTPAIIGLVTMTVNIAANIIALHSLPSGRLVAGLGVGFGLANLVGTVIAWRILSRRLHGLDGYLIGRSLVRMHAAAVPAALLAVIVAILTGNALVIVIIGGGLALIMYLIFARALRIDELTSLTRTVLARLGR
ncbi:MAG TPA: murein biosynthesis integral membrane protein MurJ [Streptosporangiaceae bacterium]|nr:murein biosynthesis integral membrane protein MurJ [Streptosporangiaceae bacterium]